MKNAKKKRHFSSTFGTRHTMIDQYLLQFLSKFHTLSIPKITWGSFRVQRGKNGDHFASGLFWALYESKCQGCQGREAAVRVALKGNFLPLHPSLFLPLICTIYTFPLARRIWGKQNGCSRSGSLEKYTCCPGNIWKGGSGYVGLC